MNERCHEYDDGQENSRMEFYFDRLGKFRSNMLKAVNTENVHL